MPDKVGSIPMPAIFWILIFINMKKLLILFILLLLPTFLIGLDLGISFSMRTSNTSNLLNYQFVSDFNYKDHIKAEFQYEKNNGITHFNYITELTQKWSYLAVSSKRTFIEDKINQISLEALGRYLIEQKRWNFWLIKFISNGYWEAGLRQCWDKNIPSTNIVIGKSYSKELKFFLIPAKYEYSLFYYSNDFKKWLNESSLAVNFSILANLDFFVKYLLKEDWLNFRMGLRLNI